MVVLRTALLAVLATACYSPDVRDCTVACNQLADCAPGQVCGTDGFCAAEDVAGRCASVAGPDGSTTKADAPPAPPDAPPAIPMVTLEVHIDGRGTVMIAGVGTCDAGSGQMTCPFSVKKGVPITLHATPKNNWRFDHWSDACDGTPTTSCAVLPAANVSARVQFELVDDSL